MTEREHEDQAEEKEETLKDLDLPAQDSEDVKGGAESGYDLKENKKV